MTVSTVPVAERMTARGIAWLNQTRNHVVLPVDVPADLVDSKVFKALSELALAGRIVSREGLAGTEASSGARELLDFVWAQLGEGDVLYRLQARNASPTYAIEGYSLLAAAGYRHAALDVLCAHLATLRGYVVPEVVPNRQLAIMAAARRLGLPPHRDPAELTAWTWLGGKPEPWMLDTFNGYSVTHTVFHLTDHGANPEGLPEDLQEYLRRWLPVWIEVYTESGFWDLLGELLIIDMCLTEPTWNTESWARYAEAQHADGMMPNGLNRPTDDPEQTFKAHYHSTVVAVIAGALAVSRGLGGGNG